MMRIPHLFFVFLTALTVTGCVTTAVLSGYESRKGANGLRRSAPHAGIDYAGTLGGPIIAAASGTMHTIIRSRSGCGIGVSISHGGGLYTVYCHMSGITRLVTQYHGRIERGDVIGYVGISGNAVRVPHVHFELSRDGRSHADGDLEGTEDPNDYLIGCFDPKRTYSRSEFQLTSPIPCSTPLVAENLPVS